jgi:cellulose synthase/poly-beta-1,6-N-acetylglucosamine synthase-like glycosyltransferase
MLLSIFIFNSLLLSLTLINSLTLRRPIKSTQIEDSILVLLPVRDEESNIDRILGELLGQENCSNFSIFLLNDNSSDRTRHIAETFASPRLKILDVPEPAKGWIGKVNALEYGLSRVETAPDYIISIDADVSFSTTALADSVATIKALNLDFISAYPRQIAKRWGERLIQPLLQWSWMSTLFLRGAEKYPFQSTVVCNGQFLVMKYSSLISSGGFASVSSYVLDDIELGRAFVRAGFKGAVIDGSEIAATRMYSSFKEIKQGYGKSLHLAFGGIVGTLIASVFIIATSIAPLIFTLTGNLLALAALLAIIGTRLVSALSCGSRLRDSFLHPFSAALLIYLLYYSWRNKSAAQWKGRAL